MTRVASILTNEEASATDLCNVLWHAGHSPVYTMAVSGGEGTEVRRDPALRACFDAPVWK